MQNEINFFTLFVHLNDQRFGQLELIEFQLPLIPTDPGKPGQPKSPL